MPVAAAATPSMTVAALPVLVVRPSVVPTSSDYGVIRPTEIDFSPVDQSVNILRITWGYWTVSGGRWSPRPKLPVASSHRIKIRDPSPTGGVQS